LILGDETLEKIASAPVSAGAGGERSKPAKPVKILKASVTRPK
jgi:hypothetical protein